MLGEKVGSYVITGKIGEGGMGVVYSAEHQIMHSRAAVKVLRVEHALSEEMAQRFINEATAAATIRHPGIVSVMDVGRLDSGVLYILMEYLDGESLATRIKRLGRLTLDDATSIIQQCARALDAAHARNIVHRDLKPDNIFLVPDPEVKGGERAKLLDFGIAKLAGNEPGSMAMTKSGAMMGTPLYMSPEQCRGAGEVDHRTDLYALGCIMFEMLTGRPPYLGKGVGDLIASHLKDPIPSMRSYNEDVPEEIDQLVTILMAKEPAQRFASASALNAALQNALSRHATLDTPSPPASPAGRADTLLAGTPALDITHPSQPGSSTTSPDHSAVGPTTTLGASASQMAAQPSDAKTAKTGAARWLIPMLALAGVGVAVYFYGATRGQDRAPATERTTDNARQPAVTAADARKNLQPEELTTSTPDAKVAAGSNADLDQRCAAKQGPACVTLGERYEGGKGADMNLKRAVDYYERACNYTVYAACERARLLYAVAFKQDMPYARQVMLVNKACAGEPKHCDQLALVTLASVSSKGKSQADIHSAQSIAIDLYQRACTAKNMSACVQLGSKYSGGKGVPMNKTRAAGLYYEACMLGEADGCLQLAWFYEDGRGVPNKDKQKADQLYRKSAGMLEPICTRTLAAYKARGVRDWRGMSSCDSLAYQLDAGVGITKDKARAKRVAKQLCAMGRKNSCL